MLRYTPRRRPLAIRRCRPGEVHTVEEGLDAGAGAKDSHGPPRVCATKALVLELIDGPTLEDRIKLGRIPVDEALPIAKQIAEALEGAHEAGIIHRDLKFQLTRTKARLRIGSDGPFLNQQTQPHH